MQSLDDEYNSFPCLPLYIACKSKSPIDVVETLLAAYAEVAHKKDGSGKIKDLVLAASKKNSTKKSTIFAIRKL
jgi:hypothetical protein